MRKLNEFLAMHQKMTIAVVLIIAVAFPFITKNQYYLRIATLCLMYIVLNLGLNLVTGYMGQMSFGQAAFWGIGSYTAAILITKHGFTTIPALLCAAVVAGLFGYLVAIPTLKLRGYYLTIVTMGFCEIVRLVELNWTKFTGGPLGIMNIPSFSFFGVVFETYRSYYLIALILVAVATIVIRNMINSNYGLAIQAIRDDSDAAELMGINIVQKKRLTFVVSAVFAGVAGAFYAQYVTFIHPSIYTTAASQELIAMIIVGGLGSIPGTFLGTILLTVLPEVLRSLMQYRMLIYGALMVLMMAVKPDGIMGSINFDRIRNQIIDQRAKKAGQTVV